MAEGPTSWPGDLALGQVLAGEPPRPEFPLRLRETAPAAWFRLAAAGVWVLNEKRLTERAGLDAIQDRLAQTGPDLGSLVSDVRARLEPRDDVWGGG